MDQIEQRDEEATEDVGTGTSERKRRFEYFNEDDAENAKRDFYEGFFSSFGNSLGNSLGVGIAAAILGIGALLLHAAYGKTESNLGS